MTIKNKLLGLKEAAFLPTLLVVTPPAIIGFLASGKLSLAGLAALIAVVVLWDVSANVLNNYFDWEIDKVNKKRNVMHEQVSKRELFYMYLIFAIGSALVAVFILKPGAYFYIFYGIEVLLAILYSSTLLKLKDRFVINYICIAIGYGLLSFLMGFYVNAPSQALLEKYLPIGLFLGILYFSITIVKDYGDVEGDAKHNKITLQVLIGRLKTLRLQYILISISYAILLVLILMGIINALFLLTFLFYFSLMYIMSKIARVEDSKKLRQISFYTQINTFALDLLMIVILFYLL